MHKTDYLNIDGHLLNLFLLVFDEGSVSGAASRLGINQSSASHGLERLRKIVGDPLFVRSGRGIAPTARPEAMAGQVREFLAQLEQLAEPQAYDAMQDKGVFSVAANDYEVETIIQPFMAICRKEAPEVTLQVVRAYTQKEWTKLLREHSADLVLAPLLKSDEADLVQQALLSDKHLCFYDPKHQYCPDTLDAFCAAPHAIMMPGRLAPTELDQLLAELGRKRSVVAAAPGFAQLAALIRNTDIIANMPSSLAGSMFAGFIGVEPPISIPEFTIGQIWHVRNSASARHKWLRRKIRQIAKDVEMGA